MRILLTLLLACLLALPVWAWTPPEKPDPRRILLEARDDADAGRLEQAAAKHLWYHRHALAIDPAQSGVRLSFALKDWHELAERHPPAMRDLLAVRDAAAARMASDSAEQAVDGFFELTRINSRLARWDLIQAAFAQFASRHPTLAPRMLRHALPALVERRDHQRAAQHLELEPLMQKLTEQHMALSATSGLDAEQAKGLKAFNLRHGDLEWSRPVWVLVKAGRRADAESCAQRGRALLGAGAQSPFIDAALKGVAPPIELEHGGLWERLLRSLVRLFG